MKFLKMTIPKKKLTSFWKIITNKIIKISKWPQYGDDNDFEKGVASALRPSIKSDNELNETNFELILIN